jgi:hypothetical protein
MALSAPHCSNGTTDSGCGSSGKNRDIAWAADALGWFPMALAIAADGEQLVLQPPEDLVFDRQQLELLVTAARPGGSIASAVVYGRDFDRDVLAYSCSGTT